jgi:hypothetical protein
MLKKDFEEFLTRKESVQSQEKQINWETEKQEWLAYLDQLYGLFEKALKSYKEQGRVTIAYDEIEIMEEYVGTYRAKRMTIGISHGRIILTPIGTNLIGAKGRVDMSGKSGSVRIVLVDSHMKRLQDHIKVSVYVGTTPPEDVQKPKEEPITWEWRFLTAPPTYTYQPVNDDTIYSALMELSNG